MCSHLMTLRTSQQSTPRILLEPVSTKNGFSLHLSFTPHQLGSCSGSPKLLLSAHIEERGLPQTQRHCSNKLLWVEKVPSKKGWANSVRQTQDLHDIIAIATVALVEPFQATYPIITMAVFH